MRALLSVLCLGVSSAQAAPVTLQHQARLLSASGDPLNGELTVQVALFSDAVTDTALWTGEYPVNAVDGYFSVVLGADGTLDSADLIGQRFMELSVNNSLIGPRSAVSPVAAAAYALVASSLGGNITTTTHGGLRVGNTVYGAWAAAVPSAFNGGGYATGALQMKTALPCGNAPVAACQPGAPEPARPAYMWHMEFVGHDFIGNSPFRVVNIGYSEPCYPAEIQGLRSIDDYGTGRVSAYCSADKNLSFELTHTGSHQWHASDLVVNLLHGASDYERHATDGFAVTATREGSRY